MKTYIVFGNLGQFIVDAETTIRAIQAAILNGGGLASDWVAHDFSQYNQKLQARLRSESTAI